MIRKVETERFTVTSPKPFDAVVRAIKAAIGHLNMADPRLAAPTHEHCRRTKGESLHRFYVLKERREIPINYKKVDELITCLVVHASACGHHILRHLSIYEECQKARQTKGEQVRMPHGLPQ